MRANAACAAASPAAVDVGVEHEADERAHVGRARLDAVGAGGLPRGSPARPIASAAIAAAQRGRVRRRRRPQRGAHGSRTAGGPAAALRAPPPTATPHSVTPGIGTGGVGIAPQSSALGIRLGAPSACSQVCFSSLSGLPARMLAIRSVCSCT